MQVIMIAIPKGYESVTPGTVPDADRVSKPSLTGELEDSPSTGVWRLPGRCPGSGRRFSGTAANAERKTA